MEVLLTPPNEVSSIWNEVAPLIQKGLVSHEDSIADDYLEPLKRADSILWIVVDDTGIESVVLGEIINYPRKKSFLVEVWATKSGYNFNEIYPIGIQAVKDFAEFNGCDYIEAVVRKGLARKFKKLKWNDNHSLVTLTL